MVFEAVNEHMIGPLPMAPFRAAIGSRDYLEPAESRTGAAIVFPNPLPSASELTELLFDEALRRAEGNQSVAARLLGVSPQAVSKRLKIRRGKDDNPG
jgi:transcriptional regulator with AAA-type ATPase domain